MARSWAAVVRAVVLLLCGCHAVASTVDPGAGRYVDPVVKSKRVRENAKLAEDVTLAPADEKIVNDQVGKVLSYVRPIASKAVDDVLEYDKLAIDRGPDPAGGKLLLEKAANNIAALLTKRINVAKQQAEEVVDEAQQADAALHGEAASIIAHAKHRALEIKAKAKVRALGIMPHLQDKAVQIIIKAHGSGSGMAPEGSDPLESGAPKETRMIGQHRNITVNGTQLVSNLAMEERHDEQLKKAEHYADELEMGRLSKWNEKHLLHGGAGSANEIKDLPKLDRTLDSDGPQTDLDASTKHLIGMVTPSSIGPLRESAADLSSVDDTTEFSVLNEVAH